MSLIIQNEVETEFLTDKEVVELTGSSRWDTQKKWLEQEKWQFTLNRKCKIKISRWYARIKMSGININNDIDISGDNQLPNFHKAS